MNWRETWRGSCFWRPMIFSKSDRHMPWQPIERRRRQLLAKAVRICLILHVLPLASGGPSLAGASQTIKIGTLAPEGSSWVTALRAIDRDLRIQTDGELKLKIYPGGVQGDEDVMIRKLRIGQLHAGGFGGKGVSDIFEDVLALETPFLFNGYDEIDYVLERMAEFYSEGYARNGYVLLGWSDVGFVHLLSKMPIAGVDDLRGPKVWRLQREPITEVLFEKMGVTSVPLSIQDVLMGLQTNLVEVVYAPPSAAIVLQWFTRVQYITDLPINYAIGALLLDRRVFDRLTPVYQQLLLEVSQRHLRAQAESSRKDNEESLAVMAQQGLVRVEPPAKEIEAFRDLVDDSMSELVGNAFSRDSFELIQKHLADYRISKAESP